jgi:outer membrane protein OmpA-like peptidoglycan-associated protein
MLLLIAIVSLSFITAAQDDVAGSKDYPLLTRLNGFYIIDYKESDYERFAFIVPKGKDAFVKSEVEGKQTTISYKNKDGVKASRLQILKNYVNATRKAGGTVVFDGDGREWNYDGGLYTVHDATLKFTDKGREIWVSLTFDNSYLDPDIVYVLTVVEKGELEQQVTASADMLKALNDNGRVALYINFDTGKDVIKSESTSVVDEVVTLLKQNPSLTLSIEGHTDNTGVAAANLKLSELRAKAVLNALVAKGIEAKRLSAKGFGQTKPLQDNTTEEGRAKNRRVELVKI